MTQDQIQQTILSAQYAMAIQIQVVGNKMSVGDNTSDWKNILRYNQNIQALSYQYNRGDYLSTPLYDCLNKLIGVDTTNNNIDPNFQNPSVIIDGGGGTGSSVIVQVPFTNVTGLTINWQTDIPAGYTQTYAQLLGNYFPNPIVWFDNGDYNSAGNEPAITYTGGLIQTVVFDWGVNQSGYLRF